MSFYGLGSLELLVIFLIVLLVLEPSSLPKIGKYLAKYLGSFKSISDKFKREIDVVVMEDKDSREDIFYLKAIDLRLALLPRLFKFYQNHDL